MYGITHRFRAREWRETGVRDIALHITTVRNITPMCNYIFAATRNETLLDFILV